MKALCVVTDKKVQEVAPKLLDFVQRVVQKTHDPSSRQELDGHLVGVGMSLDDIREAANLVHAATGVVLGIPDQLPEIKE